MTTPDIAGLCERLRAVGVGFGHCAGGYARAVMDAYGTLPVGQLYFDLAEAADTLERQAAEIERLRKALWPFAQVKPTAAKGFVNICALNVDVIEARAALTGEDPRPAHTAPHLVIVPTPDENEVPIALGDWTPDGAPATLTGEDAATRGLSGKTQTDARTRGDG